ncbi:uncharacterized protein FN964_003029 isoform 1-T9 [Alca torda]
MVVVVGGRLITITLTVAEGLVLHGGEREAEAREPQPAPAAAGGREGGEGREEKGGRAGGIAGRCRRIRRGYSWHHFPEPEVTGRRSGEGGSERGERAPPLVTSPGSPRAAPRRRGKRGGGATGSARPRGDGRCPPWPPGACVRRRGREGRRRQGFGRAKPRPLPAGRGDRRSPFPRPPRELPGEPVPTRRGRRVSSQDAGSSCPLPPSASSASLRPLAPARSGSRYLPGRTIHRPRLPCSRAARPGFATCPPPPPPQPATRLCPLDCPPPAHHPTRRPFTGARQGSANGAPAAPPGSAADNTRLFQQPLAAGEGPSPGADGAGERWGPRRRPPDSGRPRPPRAG